jgi:hypothetical protein
MQGISEKELGVEVLHSANPRVLVYRAFPKGHCPSARDVTRMPTGS